MENGKWKVESGKWKMENGKWKVEKVKGKWKSKSYNTVRTLRDSFSYFI
ncbi:MAG: hypothetical protein IPG02_17455 [Ignavibacteria bacterium]|nr:hypothetical protein [Ignavibacteria bacterium]